jgi:hypothetical protein
LPMKATDDSSSKYRCSSRKFNGNHPAPLAPLAPLALLVLVQVQALVLVLARMLPRVQGPLHFPLLEAVAAAAVVVGLGGMGMLLPTAKVVVTAIMVAVVERVSGPHTVAPVVVAGTSKVFSLVLHLGKLLHTLV